MAIQRTINESRDSGDIFPSGGALSSLTNENTESTVKNSTFLVAPDKETSSRINELEPEEGRIVYDDTAKGFVYWNGTEWVSVGSDEASFQKNYGIVDYNDASTAATPITLVPDTWIDIPNDKLGAFTNELYLPDGFTSLMNANGELDFTELTLGSSVFIRADFSVTPNINNALLEARYVLGDGGGEYALGSFRNRLDSGSGIPYPSSKGAFFIYMGDVNTRDAVGKLQLKLSSNGTVVNKGVAIAIFKR